MVPGLEHMKETLAQWDQSGSQAPHALCSPC